jgi:hypothetical protein
VPRAATAVRAILGYVVRFDRARSADATTATNSVAATANATRFHARSPASVIAMLTAVVSAQTMSVPVAGARSQSAALSTVAVAAMVHPRPGRGVFILT